MPRRECARLRSLAQFKSLLLAVETPDFPVEVRTDRIKLVRILDNLISNAIKFTESGGGTPEQAVLIRVTATGVGMDSTALERIFDEAVPLRNPERDRQNGWGLGLAISRRLITLMGGET